MIRLANTGEFLNAVITFKRKSAVSDAVRDSNVTVPLLLRVHINTLIPPAPPPIYISGETYWVLQPVAAFSPEKLNMSQL